MTPVESVPQIEQSGSKSDRNGASPSPAPVLDRGLAILEILDQALAVAGRMPRERFAGVSVEVMQAAREIERRLRG